MQDVVDGGIVGDVGDVGDVGGCFIFLFLLIV